MKVIAIRYDLEHQPGYVTFEFRDTENEACEITEKLPVVGLPYPKDELDVPFKFEAPSQVLHSRIDAMGREILTIEFLYQIQSDDGQTEFEVFATEY